MLLNIIPQYKNARLLVRLTYYQYYCYMDHRTPTVRPMNLCLELDHELQHVGHLMNIKREV
jgi:hypothetical protein